MKVDNDHILYIIGAGPGTDAGLTGQARSLIESSRIVAAGKRLLALAPDGARTFAIGSDLAAVRDFVAGSLAQGDVCVLASGDPGCFSITPFLKEYFPGRIELVPGISAVQLLSARLREPWQEWRLVSMHGRTHTLAPMPSRMRPTLYFCDASNSPQAIAGGLPAVLGECRAAVGTDLGRPGETIWEGTLSEAAASEFPGNSVLLVIPLRGAEPAASAATAPVPARAPGAPGIPDELWLRRERIPLSKSEVRAVLLAKAQPRGRFVIWDSGAGTGSYGVECSLIEPAARVFAIDKNPEACELVVANARRFGAVIETVCGEAPACYDDLPRPDLVIIGGNDGRLEAIFTSALAALLPGGRLVVTALLEQTKKTAHALFAASGLEGRAATRIAISRGKARAWEEQNPVTIFTGDKPHA